MERKEPSKIQTEKWDHKIHERFDSGYCWWFLDNFFKHPLDTNSSTESSIFARTRELIKKYKDTPFNSTITERSTSRIFDEAPCTQELRMAAPSKKSKNTDNDKKYEKIRKTFVDFAMWTLTVVHCGLGVKLQSVTIGSMYFVLGSFQKIERASVNGFVKITI